MTERRHTSLALATLVLVLATPVASWWLVGDQTNELARQAAAQGEQLDYWTHPVSLGALGDRIAGIVACVGFIGALAVLVRDTATRRLDPWWWLALLPLVTAFALVGLAWRALTAGGIGANIGAGLTIMFGGPLIGLLLLIALAARLGVAYRDKRRRRPQPL